MNSKSKANQMNSTHTCIYIVSLVTQLSVIVRSLLAQLTLSLFFNQLAFIFKYFLEQLTFSFSQCPSERSLSVLLCHIKEVQKTPPRLVTIPYRTFPLQWILVEVYNYMSLLVVLPTSKTCTTTNQKSYLSN